MKKIKALFVLVLALLVTLTLAGCKKEGGEETTSYASPTVTDKAKVEFSNDNVSVTKEEVYKMVKYYGGVSSLVQMIDEKILTETISGLTTTDEYYVSRYNRTVYGTTDLTTLTTEEQADKLSEFTNTMYLMGYKTQADIEKYIKVLAARDKYAFDYIKGITNKKDSLYVTEEKVEAYYNTKRVETVSRKAIIINFTSANDYLRALKNNGYVQFNAGLYELDPSIPPRTYSADTLVEVTDIQNAFAKMYKEVYEGQDGYVEGGIKVYNYTDLSKNASTIANKLFSMKTGEYTYMVTPNKVSYGTVYTLIYVTEGDAYKEYSSLTDTEKALAKDAYIKSLTETNSNVNKAMASLRESKNLKINDRALAYDYYSTYDTGFSYKNIAGNNTIIAEITGYQVTADDYYNYSTKNNMEYYCFYAAIPELQSKVELYTTVFGKETDVDKNASLRKSSYYKTLKAAIDKSFNVATYETEAMYLYRNYGFESMDDVVKYYYMANDLRYLTVLDMLYNVDADGNFVFNENEYGTTFNELIDDYYDTYFSFKVYDVVITKDSDMDYVVDDMTGLESSADAAAYTELYDWIKSKITAKTDKSVSDATEVVKKMIKEFNSASRKTNATVPQDGFDDEIENAKFKSMGLTMSYKEIGATTYTSDRAKYSKEFSAKLAELFKDSKKPTTSSEMSIADSLVYDENGLHFIYVTYNTKELKYNLTAKYTTDENGDKVYDYEYDKAYYNDDEKLNLAQLSTYYVLASFNSLFTDAETALTDYLIDVYPGNAPSDMDFKAYVSALDNYFVSETFVNQYYINLLKGGKFDTEYTKYASIYAEFQGEILG